MKDDGRERRMTGESYKDRDGNSITLEALCRTDPEWACWKIRHLRAALETARRDRDAWIEWWRSHQDECSLGRAEAAIIADLRESANLLDGEMVPSSDFATHNRAIASALRKSANRYERGAHREENDNE